MRHLTTLLLGLVVLASATGAAFPAVDLSGAAGSRRLPVTDTLPASETASDYERQMGWFSRDKAYHFTISAVGAGGVYAIGRELGLSRAQSAVASVVILGTVGIWKEVGTSDRGNLFTRAHLSRRDLVWDGLGIAVGISLTDLFLEQRGGDTTPGPPTF